MHKIIKYLEKAIEWFSFGVLTTLLITIWLQVFTRYILNDSLQWTEEISRFVMIWGVLVGANIAYLRGYIISISFITDKLPKKLQQVFTLIRTILILGFNGILFYYGIIFAKMGLNMVSPASGIKYFWVYISIPIGAFLLFFLTIFGAKYKSDDKIISKLD